MIFISSSEDPSDASCVFAPAVVLLPALLGTALSSVLDPSWASSLASSGIALRSPPTSAPPHSPRDCPACRLSSTLLSGVEPALSPVRPWCEVKSRRGAPKRVNTEGFACPNHQCPSFGITDAHMHASSWRWHAWPCRAHPNLSLSGLPYDVHCPAPYSFVPVLATYPIRPLNQAFKSTFPCLWQLADSPEEEYN
jgi:hypothetical protein